MNFDNFGQENIVEEYFKDLQDLSIKNTSEFLEYIKEFESMGLFNEIMKNSQLKKIYNSIKNNYITTNGIGNKFDELVDLQDNQQAFINLINNVPYKGNNRYYQAIHQFLHKHLNNEMGTFELEEIDNLIDNIGKYPSLRIIKKKIETEQNILKPNDKLIKHLKLILEVGYTIQHTIVKGFSTNIFVYLLSGLCILSARQKLNNNEFKTFNDLLMYVKSFCQLYLINNVYEAIKMKNDDYNLITFIKFKSPGLENEIYNYRYTTADEFCKEYETYAKEYKKLHNQELKTKLVDDEKGKYILTKYTKKELRKLYEQFENDYKTIIENGYKEEDIKKLIIEFFSSQCLTRSTCLIGTLMLVILLGKTIKLTDLIDYEAILTGKITSYKIDENDEYYKNIDEIIEKNDEVFKNLKLNDVLLCLKVLKDNCH